MPRLMRITLLVQDLTAIIENKPNNIKKQFEKEQADWDKQFGSTHPRDGSAKKAKNYF